MTHQTAHSDPSSHPQARRPIDHSYRVVVRAVLGGIVGAMVLAIAVWWVMT